LKKWLVIFVIFFSFLALYYYWGPFYEMEENTTAPLKTFTVEKGDLSVVVTATGTVKPNVEVEVKSKAAGEILSFPFDEGAGLKKGQVVVRLDPELEISRVNQARAELHIAEGKLERARVDRKDTELRLKRQKQLFEKGVISRQAYDDAVIAQQLKEAEDRLEDTEIRAPLGGTILEKLVEEGQVITSTISSVSEGTPLFTMADLSRIYSQRARPFSQWRT
jgi:HlyD family secretion protein